VFWLSCDTFLKWELYFVEKLYSFHTNFNIIILSKSRSSKRFLSFSVSNQQPVGISLLWHACYTPHPVQPTWLEYSNKIWRGIQILKLFIIQFPLSSFSRALSVYVGPLMRDTNVLGYKKQKTKITLELKIPNRMVASISLLPHFYYKHFNWFMIVII
jgi:hypothetical protein